MVGQYFGYDSGSNSRASHSRTNSGGAAEKPLRHDRRASPIRAGTSPTDRQERKAIHVMCGFSRFFGVFSRFA
jgi:hypothetical protein